VASAGKFVTGRKFSGNSGNASESLPFLRHLTSTREGRLAGVRRQESPADTLDRLGCAACRSREPGTDSRRTPAYRLWKCLPPGINSAWDSPADRFHYEQPDRLAMSERFLAGLALLACRFPGGFAGHLRPGSCGRPTPVARCLADSPGSPLPLRIRSLRGWIEWPTRCSLPRRAPERGGDR
jgi:hypothetical protein